MRLCPSLQSQSRVQTVGKYAPQDHPMMPDRSRLQIGDVVGKQGKVINRIIAETGVKIDIDR